MKIDRSPYNHKDRAGILASADRGLLAACRDKLDRWDTNHRAAAAEAARQAGPDRRGWYTVWAHMPETTMCSEYMPGRRKLLERASPNNNPQPYIHAAFGREYLGPLGMMPLDLAYQWMKHDDLRGRWQQEGTV